MGRPPVYVFIVRHGNRLDAADKQWHLSSPSPYDPPLTYGGWQQSKTLGARIASILREREAEDAAAAEKAAIPKKKRRYRVILHSSPFLRCVQTSIAISAGLAANPSSQTTSSKESVPIQARASRANQVSSFSNPAPTRSRPTFQMDAESPPPSAQTDAYIEKSVLRLDPFLGEWLSPDYFEHITPPPKSSLMLMTAKAELLRRENYNSYPHFQTRAPPPTSSPKLWNSPKLGGSPLASHAESVEPPTTELDNLPGLEEPSGYGVGKANGDSDLKAGDKASLPDPNMHTTYVSPVPAYAISPVEPIPSGYVAHARDACVDIDYQWDSTRDSLGWGDGGVLPEEWAAMHQRFRKGLRRLVDWYTTTDQPGSMVTKTPTSPKAVRFHVGEEDGSCAVDEDDDSETENVVILVSHGAGCNALVGGVTNQPVLADVPMSSLSTARRRPEFDDSTNVIDDSAPASLDDAFTRQRPGVPELYELKMFANTDHLRSNSTTVVSRSSSTAGISSGPWSRLGSSAMTMALREINLGPQYSQNGAVSRSNSANASLGSMRRAIPASNLGMRSPSVNATDKGGITVGSGVTSFSTNAKIGRSSSFGLWAPKLEADKIQEEEPEPPMTLDFSVEKELKARAESPPMQRKVDPDQERGHLPVRSFDQSEKPDAIAPAPAPPSILNREEDDKFDGEKLFGRWAGASSAGLWGAPRPPGEAERSRDFTSQKRRWTVTERPV